MNTARLLLPSLLLAYFLWRSLRQRVFLLGLPFLMNMYFSVFFERLKPLWIPGRGTPADAMIFWLVVTWIVYFDLLLPRRRRSLRETRLFGPRLSGPEETVLIGFAAYTLFKVGTTALRYMDLGSALGEARLMLYIFVGYFLLRGILCHAGRKETIDFLGAIVVVNSIAAGLYVLHQALHVWVYEGAQQNLFIQFQGQVLSRSFYYMPQYLLLAIAFCAAKRTWSLLWIGVMIVSLAAVWVSYTRTLILVAIVEIAVVVVVRLLRRQDARAAARRVVQIALVLGVFVAAAVSLLPTQSAFLFSRIAEAQSSGGALKDNNFQVRLEWWRTTYDWLGDNPVFGAGFPSAAQDGRMTRVGQMAADFVWVPTLWSVGLLGVAVLTALFATYAWRASELSFSTEGDASFLSTVLLAVILGTFILGFQEWTILNPWHTPLALTFFVLLTAERCRQRALSHAATSVAGDSTTSSTARSVGVV